jgi:hypothetical protein
VLSGLCLALILGLMSCPVGQVVADIKVAPNERRDEKLRGKLIPVPVEMTLEVVRGSDVEFIVRAPTPSPKRVEFLVRAQPLVGSLEGPMVVPEDKHAASFRYFIPADTTMDLVVIEVAARLPGGGVSKAAPMRIWVKEAEAILDTSPKMVRFERAVVGKPTRYSPVEVTNIGNATFRGAFSFPPGWTAHNLDGEITIEPGASHRFGLQYMAAKAGFFDEVKYLQPGTEESGLHLVANAIRVMAVTPGKLVLEWDEATQTRRGKLSFHNRDDIGWTLHLWGNDRMEIPPKVYVAGGQIATAEIVMPPGDIEPLDSRLVLKSGSFVNEINVTAEATPASVMLVDPSDGVIDFGVVEQNAEEVIMGVVFANKGGAVAPVTLRPDPPFSVVDGEDGIEVPGGGRRLVLLRAESSTAGQFERTLYARSIGREIPLKISFEVVAPDAIVINTSKQGIVLGINEPEKFLSDADIKEMDGSLIFEDLDKVPAELTERMAKQAFFGISPFDGRFRDHLPKVGELRPVEATRESITFAFDPVEGASSYIAEMGTVVYHPQTRLLTKEWRGLKNKDLRLARRPGEVHVTMRGIPAGSGRELRVFAVFPGRESGSREFGKPSAPVFFQTLPPLQIPWALVGIAVGAVVLLLGILAYRNPEWIEDTIGSWVGSFAAGLKPSIQRGKGGIRPSEEQPALQKVDRVAEDSELTAPEDEAGGQEADAQSLMMEEQEPAVRKGAWRRRARSMRKKMQAQKPEPETEAAPERESDPFMPGEIPKL